MFLSKLVQVSELTPTIIRCRVYFCVLADNFVTLLCGLTVIWNA